MSWFKVVIGAILTGLAVFPGFYLFVPVARYLNWPGF